MKEVAARHLTSRFHISVLQDDHGSLHIEVIKTSNGQPIPDDEPCILLRARDQLAVPLLEEYEKLVARTAYPDLLAQKEHIESNRRNIDEFKRFALEHRDRMKLPNITRGK